MQQPILRVENLIKQYDSGFALDIPKLEFQPARVYGMVGPNGAGKTTLLSLLSLLEKPSKGKIFFDQQRVTSLNSLSIRRQMNMVMEAPFLFHTTVFKNIILGLRCHSVERKSWPLMAAEALGLVGLDGFEKRYAPDLSRGEAQRVAIARALALKPKMLFLDEPFTNIDQRNIGLLEELIKIISQRYHTTVIFTTHNLWQAHRLADEVISLVEGRVAPGAVENLFSGEIEGNNGLQFIKISPHISLRVVTEKRGKGHVCIPPQDIIISHKQIDSSARNSFRGIIKKIQWEERLVRLGINVDSGVEFIVLITKTSYDKMNLSISSQVFLTFKSTAIRVF